MFPGLEKKKKNVHVFILVEKGYKEGEERWKGKRRASGGRRSGDGA